MKGEPLACPICGGELEPQPADHPLAGFRDRSGLTAIRVYECPDHGTFGVMMRLQLLARPAPPEPEANTEPAEA